ncbi:MAG: DUF4922 domain-containing protein [Thermoanaerobaculia bacterium]
MRCGLAGDLDALFESQARSWPLLAQGLEGLRASRTRGVRIGSHDVLIRLVPHRIKSTTAPVDSVSISRRPCFLCRANLPPEEEGIALDDEFTAYCNPFPILDRHLTIVHRDHRVQAIAGMVGKALEIAEALPGSFVIYNGPRCGASAPDHLHFQACSSELFPIGRDSRGLDGPAIPGSARSVVLLRDGNIKSLTRRIETLIGIVGAVTGSGAEPGSSTEAGSIAEPLLNLALQHDKGLFSVFLFLRSKHRPHVYDTGELTVSPAAIDLSGVLVVPLAADFERVAAGDVQSIFEEVSLPADLFAEIVRRFEETE